MLGEYSLKRGSRWVNNEAEIFLFLKVKMPDCSKHSGKNASNLKPLAKVLELKCHATVKWLTEAPWISGFLWLNFINTAIVNGVLKDGKTCTWKIGMKFGIFFLLSFVLGNGVGLVEFFLVTTT